MHSLRITAHELLTDPERQELKWILKEFREDKNIRNLVESLLPLIRCNERTELIKKVSQLMTPEMKEFFLRVCDEKISIYRQGNGQKMPVENLRKSAMKRKFDSKSHISRPLVRFSQDDNLSLSSSQPTIIFEVSNREKISDNFLIKTNSLDIGVSENRLVPTIDGLGSSFLDYSIFADNYPKKVTEYKPPDLPEVDSQRFKFFINVSENVRVFSHNNTSPLGFRDRNHPLSPKTEKNSLNKSKVCLKKLKRSKKKTTGNGINSSKSFDSLSLTRSTSCLEFDLSSDHFAVIVYIEPFHHNNAVKIVQPITIFSSIYLDMELKSIGTQTPTRVSVYCQTD